MLCIVAITVTIGYMETEDYTPHTTLVTLLAILSTGKLSSLSSKFHWLFQCVVYSTNLHAKSQ